MTRLLVVAALAAWTSAASAQAVSVTLSEWKIKLSRDTVQAGSVTFRVSNSGAMSHAFYVRVEGDGVGKGTREIPARQSASLSVTLKAGTYEVFCPMSDESHKIAGMKRTLIVTPGDTSGAPNKPDA